MKIKILLIYILAFTLSLSLFGCGLVGNIIHNQADINSNIDEQMPEWLTVAHRVQASEKSEETSEEDSNNNNTAATPTVTQPAATQPGSTQPAQQTEQPTQTSGTPRWQQPGTMEFIAKQRLDQLVFTYKRLDSEIAELEAKKDKTATEVSDLKDKKIARGKMYEDTLLEVAVGIGLSLEREYGIKPPPAAATTETTNPTWFQNWEHSPSGFGN